MMKHYIGGVEVTAEEALALVGNNTTRPYIRKVYRGELTIEAVPEGMRQAVSAAVAARIERDGEYDGGEVTAAELMTMLEEVL